MPLYLQLTSGSIVHVSRRFRATDTPSSVETSRGNIRESEEAPLKRGWRSFLYCSRMCRTSTVFITVCAPFSKRRILLREPPTPQDDDSLVHRPPPPEQGASRRRLRLYIYIYMSAAPISLSNKTKGNCCESYPSNPPSGRSSLDPPLLRRS